MCGYKTRHSPCVHLTLCFYRLVFSGQPRPRSLKPGPAGFHDLAGTAPGSTRGRGDLRAGAAPSSTCAQSHVFYPHFASSLLPRRLLPTRMGWVTEECSQADFLPATPLCSAQVEVRVAARRRQQEGQREGDDLLLHEHSAGHRRHFCT